MGKVFAITDADHFEYINLKCDPDRAVELEKYTEKPIVLVCKMGQQSGAAGKQLRAAGYTKVYKMSGGMMEWVNLQLPTVA